MTYFIGFWLIGLNFIYKLIVEIIILIKYSYKQSTNLRNS